MRYVPVGNKETKKKKNKSLVLILIIEKRKFNSVSPFVQ